MVPGNWNLISFKGMWHLWRHTFSVLILVLWVSSLWSNEFEAGQIYPQVACIENQGFSYSLYLPSSYDQKNVYPLVLIFEPASRASLPLEQMREAADHFGFVLACSRDTSNIKSYHENLKSAKAMWQDVATRFNINRQRTYTAGFSGGARLASEIAIVTGNIAGHIACGAGFRNSAHARKTIPFPIALVIGNQDMNYMELTDIERKLSFTKTSIRFFRFNAGHEWPPSDVFMKVFGWLELQAMRSETQELDQAFIEQFWQADLTLANQWVQVGHIVWAQRHYQRIAADYHGLRDTEFATTTATRIRKIASYKEALQSLTRLENAEKMKQRQYIQDLRNAEATLPEAVEEISLLIRPWILEKQRQDRHIVTTKNEGKRLMTQRLNDFVWRMSSERAYGLFIKGNYRESLFLYLLVTTYMPEYSFSFVQAAKCYAQLGAAKEALAFLSRGLKIGVTNAAVLANDPNFVTLIGLPKFQELFQSN